MAVGLLIAGAFGAGALIASKGRHGADIKEWDRKITEASAAGDPFYRSYAMQQKDNAMVSKAENTPKSGFFSKLAFYASAGAFCNQGSRKQAEIEREALKLAAPDLSDKGSFYYLLLKTMDSSTSPNVRLTVASFLAGRSQEARKDMMDLFSLPSTGGFYSELQRLGKSEMNLPGMRFDNTKDFMLACLRGELTFDIKPVSKPAVAAITTPAAKQTEAPVEQKEARPARQRKIETADNTRFGNYNPHRSWYRDLTTAARF